MSKNDILATEINAEKIIAVKEKVDKNGDLINEIVNKLVSEYCQPLDNYMAFIKEILESDIPPSTEELDDFTLNLPALLYFASEAQESLGVKEDVAKAIKADLYNRNFANQVGTVKAKEAAAALEIQHEYIAHLAYSRAYQKVKERIKAAYEMINSVKKVVTRRMQECEITRSDPNRYRGDLS